MQKLGDVSLGEINNNQPDSSWQSFSLHGSCSWLDP